MRRIRDDDRAFTPLAGTGLLVGVVVLLLAVLGAAMFGFIDAVAPPEAEFTVESDGEEVTITYLEGEPIAAEELYVRGQDPDGEVQFGAWPDEGIVDPGTRITVDAADGNEELRIVWEPVGFDRSATLAEHEPDTGPGWADEEVDPLGG